MKVIRGWSTNPDRPSDDPLLEKPYSLFIEFRGGDICDPQSGNWFQAPFPTRVWRAFLKYPLIPFISWRFKNKGGYLGAKIYGADSEAYLNWMPNEDVYTGSQAICISFRPFATISKEADQK